MANNIRITTPRGTIYHKTLTSGAVTATLEWNPNFGQQYTANFKRAQKFIDNEVLRRCAPRVPLRTGMLFKSGTLGTVIGSGEVHYIAPYSARQYYDTAKSRPYDANRGAYWFERMKAVDGKQILIGAQKLAGGGR